VLLSVILITHNEVHRLKACLEAVSFADEWVVVDSGSTDGTVDLARQWGARVIQTVDWPGFGPQKQRALDAARGEWVLSVDADEIVSPDLARDILRIIQSNPTGPVAYRLARMSSLCGQWMRHGDWFPDPVLRLFRRDHGRFSTDIVHERVCIEGEVGNLSGLLMHHSIDSLDQLLTKLNRYSSERALQQYRAGKRGGLTSAVAHGSWAFARSYLLRRGFLDGALGFALAVSIAEGTFWRYLKIAQLARDHRRSQASP